MITPFELRGEFAGFVRTLTGKRRLILRTAAGDVPLKVPRTLRRLLDGHLHAGCPLAVSGLEYRDERERERDGRFVLRARALAPAEAGTVYACPIRVCAKKNCWRQGGRELWRTFAEELEALDGTPALEEVDCLDRCKRAPNFDCGDLEFERCAPEHARQFVGKLAALQQADHLPAT